MKYGVLLLNTKHSPNKVAPGAKFARLVRGEVGIISIDGKNASVARSKRRIFVLLIPR